MTLLVGEVRVMKLLFLPESVAMVRLAKAVLQLPRRPPPPKATVTVLAIEAETASLATGKTWFEIGLGIFSASKSAFEEY
jgi:hypothetical protein